MHYDFAALKGGYVLVGRGSAWSCCGQKGDRHRKYSKEFHDNVLRSKVDATFDFFPGLNSFGTIPHDLRSEVFRSFSPRAHWKFVWSFANCDKLSPSRVLQSDWQPPQPQALGLLQSLHKRYLRRTRNISSKLKPPMRGYSDRQNKLNFYRQLEAAT